MATSTQWQLAQDAAERYERVLVPAILGPAAGALVEWSRSSAGESVLDVGCGTGAAARFAAQRVGASGRVVGVDVNAGMLAVARSLSSATAIEWLEHSAYELPFADGEFDVALCAQTLQFLSDRPRALSEMHRVLKCGGRAVVSLWCELEASPYFDALVRAMATHIGPETAAGLGAAFNLTDVGTIHGLLTAAGFEDVHASVSSLVLDLPSPQEFVPRHVGATPMAAGFAAATEGAREAVVQDVAAQLATYATDQGIRVPFRTHLMTGVRRSEV